MPVKTVFAHVAILAGGFASVAAGAQQNPFVPPQNGLSKDQIQQIVRQEIARGAPQTATPTRDPNAKGPKSGPGVQSQMKGGVDRAPQQQGGSPNASTASSNGQPVKADDPVAELLKAGGNFVGCVGQTPVFKDKVGRRAYFTTKELRESNEARRFARCS